MRRFFLLAELFRHKWKIILGTLVLAVVVSATFFSALKLGFYGDDWNFYDLAGRLTLSEILAKNLDPRIQTAAYRPVLGLLFRLEYDLFGPNTLGYHLPLLVFHFVNCLWLWALVSHFTSKRNAGFVAGLLFATMPTAVQAVLWPAVVDTHETFFICPQFGSGCATWRETTDEIIGSR